MFTFIPSATYPLHHTPSPHLLEIIKFTVKMLIVVTKAEVIQSTCFSYMVIFCGILAEIQFFQKTY